MTHILALDPALVTGYAHSSGPRGVWLLSGSAGEHAGTRLTRLEDFIIDAHRAWTVERIAFERAAYGGDYLATKQFHNQLRGVILLAAAKIGATWEDFSPATIKKFATDNGRATKQDMMRALKIQFGIETTSDNEADAIWILKLAEQRSASPFVPKNPPGGPRRRRRRKSPQQRMF